MKKFTFLILSLFVIASCQNNTEKGGDMGQFAEDEKFKEKHEVPDQISYEPQGSVVDFPTDDNKTGSAYITGVNSASSVLFVFHEWWGLNDHIKQEVDKLSEEIGNINVVAFDLYDGKVADNPDMAGELMQSASQERIESIIRGGKDFITSKMKKDKVKIATIGWCFGGGWSLRSSIMAGSQGVGCVMYYGMPVETAKELAPLEADVLGIFAAQEQWINKDVVNKFDKLTKATNKNFEYHFFDADHAFANPSSPRYNEAAATEANKLALEFLKKKLQVEN